LSNDIIIIGTRINCLLFADDQFIITNSETQLQKVAHKTKTMAFIREHHKIVNRVIE